MYKKIMVPVDLAHVDRLGKALTSAEDLAKHYGASVCYVGVTAPPPSDVAHTPEEYADRLEKFARAQSDRHGFVAMSRAYTSHDPAVELDDILLRAITELDADLVVMASHVPGIADHFFTSNAGYVAMHAKISVFVIR
ncbi:MAG: universal stress protein [Burkholderiales bacterium]|nr:MAG: universal stress protein [Burkholderiales bacterium]